MNEGKFIKKAAYANDIENLRQLSRECGIPYERLYRRMQDFSQTRLYELRAIVEAAGLTDEQVVRLVRGE